MLRLFQKDSPGAQPMLDIAEGGFGTLETDHRMNTTGPCLDQENSALHQVFCFLV